MKKRRKGKRTGKRKGRSGRPFSLEFKLRVVRLFLEEGYRRPILAQEFGISESSIGRWARLYRQYGEQGLKPKSRNPSSRDTPEDVRDKIIDLKRSHPTYGTRRISDILKRFFLIRTSPTTVGKTLNAEGLIEKPARKRKKNPAKPRFFERATPNQMWQSDIMTFRLGGRNAYLIGYLDDYSRYIIALGLYRSQTAEHVIETYRKGISEYGVPKEMLTDNGRQYTNWRGTTRFEKELKKERVKHIKSRPHHPMTLGKIERFWQTIQSEFLQRAQFTSFEDAAARTSFWLKYYNYKRPHQGIGGLCPADRFFEIQHALKTTLEKGIEENALELALRGKPRAPFYMVGRMGNQSVVIRAEKGKVKMLVDGRETTDDKELVYDARKDIDHEKEQTQKGLRSSSENNRRAVGMDRKEDDDPDVPGVVHQFQPAKPMAESGHGGDGYGPFSQTARTIESTEPSTESADRKESTGSHLKDAKAFEGHREGLLNREPSHETKQCPKAGGDDHEGPLRSFDSKTSRHTTGGVPQDLLQMGTAGSERPFKRGGRSERGPSQENGARIRFGKTAGSQPGRDRIATAETETKGYCRKDENGTRVDPDEKKMSKS